MKLKTLIISASLLLAVQGAHAIPYSEVGDSGDSIATSQAAGSAIAGGIIGGLGGTGDVDMYSFTWNGGGLYIDTFQPFLYDTQLFLFDAAGAGVLGNDDHGSACPGAAGSGLQSCLDLSGGLAAGTYYVAISAFNNDPVDGAATPMMSCSGFTTQCLSAGGILTSWTGPSGTQGGNNYAINFTPTNPVPEPNVLILLGIGLAGLGFARRRA